MKRHSHQTRLIPAHTYDLGSKGAKARVLSILLITLACMLTSCVSGVWTGANLFYNRHDVYNSYNDFELNTRIRNALYHDKLLHGRESHLDLAVFNGDVLLAGHVSSESIRDEVYRRAMAQAGYRRLFKRLSIQPPQSTSITDTWITTQIRSKIIADSEIDPNAFKIITSDQIVYIMGDVDPKQAEWVVTIARSTAGVKRVVKLLKYYYLSNKALST